MYNNKSLFDKKWFLVSKSCKKNTPSEIVKLWGRFFNKPPIGSEIEINFRAKLSIMDFPIFLRYILGYY